MYYSLYHAPHNDIGMIVLPSVQVHGADVALVAGVLLGGLDEIAPAVKILIVLLQRHVSVLDEHMRQMRLCSDTVGQDIDMAINIKGRLNSRWTMAQSDTKCCGTSSSWWRESGNLWC